MYKPFALLSLLLLCSVASFAQYPDPGAKSFTFGINLFTSPGVNAGASHTGTLLYKYYVHPDLAYRFSATGSFSGNYNSNDNGGQKVSSSNTNTAFGIGIGAQKNIATVDRFVIYAGADLTFTYSSTKSDNRTDTYDITKTGGGGKNGDYKDITNTTINPLSIGLFPFIGFNYFLTKNFSLGAEFAMSASYALRGTGSQITTQKLSGYELPQVKTNTANGGGFNLNPNASALITASVYF